MTVKRRKDTSNRVLKEGEYQRTNGTFEYKWRDRKGSRHSIYAKTLQELREKELDVLKDILDGVNIDRKKLTINDLYDRWIQVKKGLKHNTFQNYKFLYKQYVEKDFGRLIASEVKRTDVRTFYNMLLDDYHLRPGSIDNIHTVLHQVFDLGVEDEYLRNNPSDSALKEIKRVHSKDTEKKCALTIQEQEIFENFLEHNNQYKRWYPIFIIMLYTGMRVGEITALRWCDIDLDNNTISVNHNLVYYDKGGKEKCSFAINTPKTKAGERTIPMLPIVRKCFILEKKYRAESETICNSIIDGYTDFIFLNRFGRVYYQQVLNKAIRRIIRDCNYELLDKGSPVLLPNFSSHIFRHTFTTRMCEAGVNIKAMQDILGHADAETTLQIYTDATKELKVTGLINFEDYFNRLKEKQEGAV